MEMNFHGWKQKAKKWFLGLIFIEHPGTNKRELRFSRLKWVALSSIVIFVIAVLFLPDESDVQFAHKGRQRAESKPQASSDALAAASTSASSLWGAPRLNSFQGGGGGQVNQNTSMIVGSKNGNANTQVRAGVRLPCRFIDKFTVSQEQVPVLAELLLDSVTDSGLRLPAGTRFYGEASFQKGSDRAGVNFRQISLPSGEIRPISGMAVGKDGQPGIPGRVLSDEVKNTAGAVLTTFVSGLASGSMQTSILGTSEGGLRNGLLNAVSQTAQGRAQAYGQKLQTAREWIEVPAGSEADAILTESINLQEGGDL